MENEYGKRVKYLLCLLYLAGKKPAKAVVLMEDLVIRRNTENKVDLLSLQVHLSQAYMCLGRLTESVRLLESLLPALPSAPPSRQVHAYSQLGICYLCLNQHLESMEKLALCAEIMRKYRDLSVHPRRKYRIFATLGNLLAVRSKFTEAENSLLLALEVLKSLGETSSLDTAKVNISLSTVYMGLNRPDDALKALTKAKDAYLHIEGPQSPEIVPILTQIASVLERNNDFSAALRCLNQALESQKRLEGEYSEAGLSIWFRIVDLYMQSGQTERVVREIQEMEGRKGRYSGLGQVMIETQLGTVLRVVGDLSSASQHFLSAL